MRNSILFLISLTVLALLGACAKQEAVATTAATTNTVTNEATPSTESTETAAPELTAESPEMAAEADPVASSESTPTATTPPSENTPAPMLPRRGEVESMANIADPVATLRISVPDALEVFQSGDAVMVDVRNLDAFQFQHITGSKSIPLNEVAARAGELPQDKWIITYCTCPAEESSGAAATQLKNMGFPRVAALLGGMQAWRSAALPLELGQ